MRLLFKSWKLWLLLFPPVACKQWRSFWSQQSETVCLHWSRHGSNYGPGDRMWPVWFFYLSYFINFYYHYISAFPLQYPHLPNRWRTKGLKTFEPLWMWPPEAERMRACHVIKSRGILIGLFNITNLFVFILEPDWTFTLVIILNSKRRKMKDQPCVI